MQVTGGGNVLEYGPQEEGPHTPGHQTLWQESVVLVWWDRHNGVGGMHRIGHEPNTVNGAQISLWNNIFSRHGIFKRTVTLPLRPEHRTANGFNGGDDSCSFEYTDHAIWRINDEGVRAELHVQDFHTPVDIYPKKGAMAEEVAPNHMEVGGRIEGWLELQGNLYTINGLAFRDHGWGLRNWAAFVNHRWVAGVFDSGTMFLAQTFHSSDDVIVRFGCIIRDNQLTYASEVDIIMYLEPDGVSHRGGFVEMTLTTGEKLRLDCAPLQKGVVSWIHGIACVDTMCEVTLGDERGICDFETTNNALRGSYRPRIAVNAVIDNGFTPL
jgi:hypothetical protein